MRSLNPCACLLIVNAIAATNTATAVPMDRFIKASTAVHVDIRRNTKCDTAAGPTVVCCPLSDPLLFDCVVTVLRAQQLPIT